jgi:hypothetical protein
MSNALGEFDYRQSGLERLREAWLLLHNDFVAGGVYLGGRAVEAMLRALIWKHDADIRRGKKTLDTGHNLRELLIRVSDLGVLRDYEHREELGFEVQFVGRLWFNNMRFFSTEKLKRYWWDIGEITAKRSFKQASRDYYGACSSIVKRCEGLCQD